MHKFKAGDEVKFLNDVGGGVIKGFDRNGFAEVETEDGFTIPTAPKNLIPLHAAIDEPANQLSKNENRDFFLSSGAEPSIQYFYDDRNGSFAIGFNNPLEKQLLVQVHHLIGKNWKSVAQFHANKGVKIFHRAASFKEVCEYDKLWIQAIELSDFETEVPLNINFKLRIPAEKFAAFNGWELDLNSNSNCLNVPFREIKSENKAIVKTADKPAFYIHHKNRRGDYEIDLHAYALPEFYQTDDPTLIMKRQLAFFDKCLNEAILRKIRVLQVIHGTGEGILKHEVRMKLNEAGAEIIDGPMQLYGVGATTARFKH
jgi:hypothetical protein